MGTSGSNSNDKKIDYISNIIIWIDPNIYNTENTKYLKQLESFKNTKVLPFQTISDSLELIKTIRFEETSIIICGSLYSKFIEKFEENIRDIYVIPKIIIFTFNKEKFLENNKNYKDNSFYSLGGIQTSFEKIKDFVLQPIRKNDIEEENSLTFEYIDCKEKLILPLLYKSLIEITRKDDIKKYTENLYNKYSTNNEVEKLLYSIKYIKDIPMELLSKYYGRLYTLESKFYYDINKDLRESKKDEYMQYIKILYEGIKLKSLPLASNNILYRGSKITNHEISKIKEYLKIKKDDLPGAIVFSKSFLSFTKDEKVAEKYINKINDDKNLSKVLYIIEKDDKLNYDLSTHSDIENISRYPGEKEVLFFPFSSFEIKDLKEINYNNETIYEIKLLYLGKYLKELETIEDTKIPDSNFKKEIVGLIPKQKMEKAKEVINKYKEYKRIINHNLEKHKEINIIYNTNNKNKIKIFDENFVKNNKYNCKIVYENKEYDLMEYFNINIDANTKLDKLEIKLKEINGITNMSCMFNDCSSLSSLSDISKWNMNNVTNMSSMFNNCSSLSSLPDISKWDTTNVTDMSYMFYNCSSLSSLSDISKWNTNNVINMRSMFNNSSSLSSLPDISKWNTNNVRNMRSIFKNCSSLSSLPDISNWNTTNVTDMSYMFYNCSSLTSLPDISCWYTNNVKDIRYMFFNCSLLKSLPDLSKWNTDNVTNMGYLFFHCSSLSSLPDISKWNTTNVTDMRNIFNNCLSLYSLPDISKWNTINVTDMSFMFNDCRALSSFPNISKWNTNNVINMSCMFNNCSSLFSLPDISKWNTNKVTTMRSMFYNCSSLLSISDISKWNTTNVTDMSDMFSGCKKQLTIPKKFN